MLAAASFHFIIAYKCLQFIKPREGTLNEGSGLVKSCCFGIINYRYTYGLTNRFVRKGVTSKKQSACDLSKVSWGGEGAKGEAAEACVIVCDTRAEGNGLAKDSSSYKAEWSCPSFPYYNEPPIAEFRFSTCSRVNGHQRRPNEKLNIVVAYKHAKESGIKIN